MNPTSARAGRKIHHLTSGVYSTHPKILWRLVEALLPIEHLGGLFFITCTLIHSLSKSTWALICLPSGRQYWASMLGLGGGLFAEDENPVSLRRPHGLWGPPPSWGAPSGLVQVCCLRNSAWCALFRVGESLSPFFAPAMSLLLCPHLLPSSSGRIHALLSMIHKFITYQIIYHMRLKIWVYMCVYPISNKLQEGRSCVILIFIIPTTGKVPDTCENSTRCHWIRLNWLSQLCRVVQDESESGLLSPFWDGSGYVSAEKSRLSVSWHSGNMSLNLWELAKLKVRWVITSWVVSSWEVKESGFSPWKKWGLDS